MAIAVRQPHRSWYRQFWYAERSPRDALIDRTLLFAIVALSLVVGGMQLVRRPEAPGTPAGTRSDHAFTPAAKAAGAFRR
jgi:hypothetical protein